MISIILNVAEKFSVLEQTLLNLNPNYDWSCGKSSLGLVESYQNEEEAASTSIRSFIPKNLENFGLICCMDEPEGASEIFEDNEYKTKGNNYLVSYIPGANELVAAFKRKKKTD